MRLFIKKHPFLLVCLLLPVFFVLSLYSGKTFINPFCMDSYDGFYKSYLELRLLRTATAFIVGGALASAGAAYQAVLRNPLAEPFILGISGGASIGAALAIISGLGAFTMFAIPGCSFIGAVLILCFVVMMARCTVDYSNSIMLCGVVCSSVCSSVLMFMVSVSDSEDMNNITWWMLGNLQPGSKTFLVMSAITVVVCCIILFCFRREANILSLGEEMTYHLGITPRRVSLILLGTASLMAAMTVTLAGVISFVGLIVPHIMRRLFGYDHAVLFPMCLFGGGIFLIVCDMLSRLYPGIQDLPVGVVTALLGGPFFIWILRQRSRYGAKL